MTRLKALRICWNMLSFGKCHARAGGHPNKIPVDSHFRGNDITFAYVTITVKRNFS